MIVFIKKIEYCEAVHVHCIVDLMQSTARITDYAPWRRVPIINFAEVDCSDKAKGQRLYDIEVRADMEERMDFPHSPLAFKLTDIYNKEYLVAIPDFCPPYPMVTQQDKAAAKPSESSLCKLSVHHTAVHPLIRLL